MLVNSHLHLARFLVCVPPACVGLSRSRILQKKLQRREKWWQDAARLADRTVTSASGAVAAAGAGVLALGACVRRSLLGAPPVFLGTSWARSLRVSLFAGGLVLKGWG